MLPSKKNIYITILLGVFLTIQGIFSQTNEQKELETKRARLQQEIKTINNLLSKERKEKRSVLDQVENLEKKISVRQQLVNVTKQQANLLNRQMNSNLRNIEALREEVIVLKKDYAEMIKKSYKSKSKQSRLMFILSSENFFQAYKRLQYMKQYTNYRKEQANNIETKTLELKTLNNNLITQRKEKERLVKENEQEQTTLERERSSQNSLLATIRKNESQYVAQVKKKQQEANAIDREIERLIKAAIAEANKKTGKKNVNTVKFELTPEAEIVANKFSSNKGKASWPVEKGIKSKGYGEYRDPVYPGIRRYNNGVVIATEPGTQARAVFQGEVSAIIMVPGGNRNTTIQIRHGNYITTYYNLSNLLVKKGDKVKAKQPLGTIFSNTTTGKTEMRFYLYQNTNRLNPEEWIYKM